MTTTTVKRTINASAESVFDVIANVENFSKAIPHITNVEFLTDSRSGEGTRFKETRLMNGKEATTELEVAEYVPSERVRMVSDAGGTVWDTLFTITEENGTSEMTMVMEAKPYKLMSKIVNPLIKGMVQKAIESDLDAVKAFCEADTN